MFYMFHITIIESVQNDLSYKIALISRMFDLNAQNGNLLAVLCVEVYFIRYKITHLVFC